MSDIPAIVRAMSLVRTNREALELARILAEIRIQAESEGARDERERVLGVLDERIRVARVVADGAELDKAADARIYRGRQYAFEQAREDITRGLLNPDMGCRACEDVRRSVETVISEIHRAPPALPRDRVVLNCVLDVLRSKLHHHPRVEPAGEPR